MTTEDLGMTLEDMEAVASGTVFAPQQEEQQQEEEQPSEDVAEEQEEEEATEDAADDDEQPEASQDDDKPRMNRASQRVKEAVDRANAMERELNEIKFKFQQQMAANEKLMAMITGVDKPAAQDAEEEILDEALAKRVEAKFAKIEEKQFETIKQQEVAYVGGEQGEVYQKAIAAHAIEVVRKGNAIGQSISMNQAEEIARASIEKGFKEMHAKGAKPGAIAQELANAAAYYDFLIAQTQTNAGQKAPAGVNMKKVEEARRKAGAPTIDKESVNISGGINAYQAEVKKAKESGAVSDDYLRKLGF